MQPLISVIVPVYNVEKYLERCLTSLVNQSLYNIEIILVNDGSPDKSYLICDKFMSRDKRIKVINKKNEGLGLARNTGLEYATGEFIAFVDSDDYVSVDMCEKLYNSAKKYNADVVYGGIWKDYNWGTKIKKEQYTQVEKVWKGQTEINSLVLDFIATKPESKRDTIMEISVWKALFKREIFNKYNIKFVSERKFISEDLIFDIDYLTKAECVVLIPECIYYYCFNPNSLSKIFRADRFDKVIILYREILRKLNELYEEIYFKERTNRFIIARARANIHTIAKHTKELGYKNTREAIAKICNNKELQDALKDYPISKMPMKYFFISLLMKYKYKILLSYIMRF